MRLSPNQAILSDLLILFSFRHFYAQYNKFCGIHYAIVYNIMQTIKGTILCSS